MLEKEHLFENPESRERTPRPNLLDVVKIDGRWAQMISESGIVKYLDNKEVVEINWDDHGLIKKWGGLPIWAVKKSESFTPEELGHIHWGPEQEKHPRLREQVSVFGEFEKRLENERK